MIGRTKKSFAVFVCFGYSGNNTHGIAHEILLHTRFIQIEVFQIKKEEDRHAAVSSDVFFHIIGFSAMLVRNAPLCSQNRYTSYRMIFTHKDKRYHTGVVQKKGAPSKRLSAPLPIHISTYFPDSWTALE